jgi:hypothetical protein
MSLSTNIDLVYTLDSVWVDYFRMKNIPDNNESRLIVQDLGLDFYGSGNSIKSTARSSQAATRSNVV